MRIIHCDNCHNEIGWSCGERFEEDYYEVLVTKRKIAPVGDPESNDTNYDQFKVDLCKRCYTEGVSLRLLRNMA